MAHKKGQSSSRNGRDSNAQRRGVKRFAGDTVTATYTLALAAGAAPLQAAEIANRAAGVVVGKMGTVPIGIDELKEAISEKK